METSEITIHTKSVHCHYFHHVGLVTRHSVPPYRTASCSHRDCENNKPLFCKQTERQRLLCYNS